MVASARCKLGVVDLGTWRLFDMILLECMFQIFIHLLKLKQGPLKEYLKEMVDNVMWEKRNLRCEYANEQV